MWFDALQAHDDLEEQLKENTPFDSTRRLQNKSYNPLAPRPRV